MSWLTFDCSVYRSYLEGRDAARLGWPLLEAQRNRDLTVARTLGGASRLTFHGTIGIYPRISAFGPSRAANLDDLRGVRAEMRVLDRTYLPVSQPGDLVAHASQDYFTWDYCFPSGSGRPEDPMERVTTSETMDYYFGNFSVAFDGLDAYGNDRINPTDPVLSVVVTGRFGIHSAEYRLDELNRLMR